MKTSRKKPAKPAPCDTCGACPTCGAKAATVPVSAPVIVAQPAAPAFVPAPYWRETGPIWVVPQPQWGVPSPFYPTYTAPPLNTAGANPYPGTFIASNTTVTALAAPGAAGVWGNGYRSIWGQGGVS